MSILLNKADQALIVDLIIDASNKTNSVFCADEYLKLIKKVKGLKLEQVKSDLTFEDILNDDFLK